MSDFKEVLAKVKGMSATASFQVISEFCSQQESASETAELSVDDLIQILGALENDFHKESIFQWWSRQRDQSKPLSSEDMFKILNMFSERAYKSDVIKWMMSHFHQSLEPHEIATLVGILDLGYDKLDFIQWAFKSFDRSKKISVDDLIKIVSSIDNEWFQATATKAWFDIFKTQISLDELLKCFEKRVAGQNGEGDWLEEWLNETAYRLSENDYEKIARFFPNENASRLTSILLNRMDSSNLDLKTDYYIFGKKRECKEAHYNPGGLYGDIEYRFKEKRVECLIRICQGIYPTDEHAQVDLCKRFAGDISIKLEARQKVIKEFLISLKDDDCCLSMLEYALQNKIPFVDSDILEIVGNRLPDRFKSIEGILKNRTAKESMGDEGWSTLKRYFGEKVDEKTPLLAIFSYYLSSKHLAVLRELLKPEVLMEIQQNYQYRSSTDIPFVLPDQATDLVMLGLPSLPHMGMLCKYLKDKAEELPKTPSLDKSIQKLRLDIYSYDLTKKEKDDNPEMAYKKLFLQLLEETATMTDKNKKTEKVVKFFEAITGLDLKKQASKLGDLFEKRKDDLAYLFALPDGITDYIGIIYSIGEGCAANIGTKTNMYILGKLFKDPIDQVLFPFYSEKIFNAATAVYSQEGKDILGASATGSDIFTNADILNLYIAPEALIAGIADELKEDPKRLIKLIKALADTNEFVNYETNMLDFDNKDEAQNVETRLGAYLIIRSLMRTAESDILANKHFEGIHAECRGLMSDDFDVHDHRKTRL